MVAHHRPGRLNRYGLRLSVEQLEKRLLLDGSPWQNPDDPLDVNADVRVSAVDGRRFSSTTSGLTVRVNWLCLLQAQPAALYRC